VGAISNDVIGTSVKQLSPGMQQAAKLIKYLVAEDKKAFVKSLESVADSLRSNRSQGDRASRWSMQTDLVLGRAALEAGDDCAAKGRGVLRELLKSAHAEHMEDVVLECFVQLGKTYLSSKDQKQFATSKGIFQQALQLGGNSCLSYQVEAHRGLGDFFGSSKEGTKHAKQAEELSTKLEAMKQRVRTSSEMQTVIRFLDRGRKTTVTKSLTESMSVFLADQPSAKKRKK